MIETLGVHNMSSGRGWPGWRGYCTVLFQLCVILVIVLQNLQQSALSGSLRCYQCAYRYFPYLYEPPLYFKVFCTNISIYLHFYGYYFKKPKQQSANQKQIQKKKKR